MASVAIALGQVTQKHSSAVMTVIQTSRVYADNLVLPLLQTLRDGDARVRYFTCESLYNIMKVLQAHILIYVNELFDALSIVSPLYILTV